MYLKSQLVIMGKVIALSILLASCQEKVGENNEKKNINTNLENSYSTRGYVQELMPDDNSAFIHHEEISGFMDEMVMYLKLEDPSEYSKLKVGHQYTFDMIVDKDDGTYIRNIVPTGRVKEVSIAGDKPSDKWFKKPIFELGDRLPDFSLNASDGKVIDQSKLKGGAWAITFIFTRCPLPDYCPMMSLRFYEAVNLLKEAKIKDWNLVSLTIDPEFDTNEVLNEYKKVRGFEYENWFFCRASLDEVRKVGDPLGLSFNTQEFPIEHNLRTAVFDSEGKLAEVFSGNKWTAKELTESIIKATIDK